MARLKPEDVELWASIIRAAVPAGFEIGALAVQGIAALIQAVRRMRGEPVPTDDEATIEAAAVVAALTKAQAPWQRVVDTAETQLAEPAPAPKPLD